MSLWNRLKSIWRWLRDGSGHGVDELARRLGRDAAALAAVQPIYREFTIPKRSGGTRAVSAPDDQLKSLQRQILRRLLSRLRTHRAATGFQKGESIVTHARRHVGQAVVVRLDLKNFFPSTSADRVWAYFRRIGWNRPATRILTRLCTHQGGLPQGAPTSPRLSNLVNFRFDARLAALARKLGLRYSRYADDITLSFSTDDRKLIRYMVRFVCRAAWTEGYVVHRRKKLHIRRRHQQQRVTGLVVNDRVHLPRNTRRWLRAVDHHLQTGRPATLSPAQRAGWWALQIMIAEQSMSLSSRPLSNEPATKNEKGD
jgi:retron-type reverse transcriptase